MKGNFSTIYVVLESVDTSRIAPPPVDPSWQRDIFYCFLFPEFISFIKIIRAIKITLKWMILKSQKPKKYDFLFDASWYVFSFFKLWLKLNSRRARPTRTKEVWRRQSGRPHGYWTCSFFCACLFLQYGFSFRLSKFYLLYYHVES